MIYPHRLIQKLPLKYNPCFCWHNNFISKFITKLLHRGLTLQTSHVFNNALCMDICIQCLAEENSMNMNPSLYGRCRRISGFLATSFSPHSSKGLELPWEGKRGVGRLKQNRCQIKLTVQIWAVLCVSFLFCFINAN